MQINWNAYLILVGLLRKTIISLLSIVEKNIFNLFGDQSSVLSNKEDLELTSFCTRILKMVLCVLL